MGPSIQRVEPWAPAAAEERPVNGTLVRGLLIRIVKPTAMLKLLSWKIIKNSEKIVLPLFFIVFFTLKKNSEKIVPASIFSL